GGGAARSDVRPRHLDQQPGDHRRDDRQQLGGQRVGQGREDDPPRPGTGAGSGSVRYGMTIDHVRKLDVVLADGRPALLDSAGSADAWEQRSSRPGIEGAVYRQLPAIPASNAQAIASGTPGLWGRAGGFRLGRLIRDEHDLAKFVVGSEGTLVIVTQALVNLVPKPRQTVIAVGHFTSTPAAIAATGDALACDPSAVELMDRMILDLSRQKIEYAALGGILHGDPE